MSSFVEIGPPVLEKKIFDGFYHIYGHGGHLGHVSWIINKLVFRPTDVSYKIWLRLAKRLQKRRCNFRKEDL